MPQLSKAVLQRCHSAKAAGAAVHQLLVLPQPQSAAAATAAEVPPPKRQRVEPSVAEASQGSDAFPGAAVALRRCQWAPYEGCEVKLQCFAELALKLMLNAVSTIAHIIRGEVLLLSQTPCG